MINELKIQWVELVAKFTDDEDQTEQYWTEIKKKYSGKFRYFLESDRIFKTTAYYEKMEEQARGNLERELGFL